MFVPRAVRLKGVKEKRPNQLPETPLQKPQVISEDALVDAMEGITTSSPGAQAEDKESTPTVRGPKFTVAAVTPEYIAQVAAAVSLIFSDYAIQEPERSDWLKRHYRDVDGEGNFVHLSAVLEHPYIANLKPAATQILLQEALRTQPSEYLELSHNKYYVRRVPSSYPPKFLPHNSFDIVDDDGLSFWDQRTIYVEPHMRALCQTPAKVAYWLQQHGQLKSKWLPIQAIHTIWNSCAFVVFSGSVMHEDIWSKWRALEKPEDWKVMTKVEHTKRTLEYLQLLGKDNPREMRRFVDTSNLPPIARPAALPANHEVAQTIEKLPAQPASTPVNLETVENMEDPAVQPKKKRKRNRRKDKNSNVQDEDIEDLSVDAVSITDKAEGKSEPSRKRRG